MAPRDDALPAARHLLDHPEPLLAAALAVEGSTVATVVRRGVVHRPGRSLTVRYRVVLRDRWGRERTESLVAVADRAGPPERTLVVEADDLAVGVFRWPHDPCLPGLTDLVRADTAAEVAGLPGPVGVEVRTYRPLQRAVVHLVGADGTERYAKALPPVELASAADRHRLAVPGLPVPPVVAADRRRGVLVLDAVPGASLRHQLTTGGPVPDPAGLLHVLHLLAGAPTDAPVGRLPPIPAAATHAALLGHVLPASRRRIARLLDRIGPDGAQPTATVHGDLHPAQLLVDGGAVSGLIDLDDVGRGAPVDDLASFLGHLACLALERDLLPARRMLGRYLAAFGRVAENTELHRRTAAVVLGLATGPYRVQQRGWAAASRRRLALAERWAAGDVRGLRIAS